MPKTISAIFLACVYAAVLLGFQAEMASVVRGIWAASQAPTLMDSEPTALQKTAIETTHKRCIHHSVACPPECHCPALEEAAHEHVEEPSEAKGLGTGDAVWRPCASHDDGLLAWDLPWQLPTQGASLHPASSPVIWRGTAVTSLVECLPRAIDKIPIL